MADKGSSYDKSNRIAGRLAALAPVLVLALLVLAQGGFFGLAPCLCGIALCLASAILWLQKRRRSEALPLAALLLGALAASYAVSAAASGLTLTTLSECGTWAGCAGMALLAASLDESTQNRSLGLLCWLGAATAVLGLLVYTGTITFVEGMVEDRLQLTFQYANAAGAWFAVGTLLCTLAPDERLHRLAALPATALLLTQSAGALIVFVLVAAVIGIVLARQGDWERLAGTLVAGCFAALCFALLHVAKLPVAALVLAALLIAYALRGDDLLAHLEPLGWQRLSLALAAAMVAAVAAGLLIFSTRVGQAASSMAERAYHVRDGLGLWLTHPLLGVGPDNWQFLYRYVQSAQYDTTVVHSSYVQVLLDAGIVGLVLLAAAAALGLRALAGTARNSQSQDTSAWAAARLAASAFLLAHATLEFSLQFASLAYLLALLLACHPQSTPAPRATRHAKGSSSSPTSPAIPGLAAGIAALALCLPLCGLGTMAELTAFSQRTALATEDYASCERLCTASSFARNDIGSQERLLTARFAQSNLAAAVAAFQSMPNPSDASALQAADACYQLGERAQAGRILIDRMEQQPYNVGFFDGAATLVEAYGLEDEHVARYHSAVDRANSLAGQVSASLPQKQLRAGM